MFFCMNESILKVCFNSRIYFVGWKFIENPVWSVFFFSAVNLESFNISISLSVIKAKINEILLSAFFTFLTFHWKTPLSVLESNPTSNGMEWIRAKWILMDLYLILFFSSLFEQRLQMERLKIEEAMILFFFTFLGLLVCEKCLLEAFRKL